MDRTWVILAAMLAVTLAVSAASEYKYGHKEPKAKKHEDGYKKRLSCYQCAWSPGKTVYKTITYYDEQKVQDPDSYKYVTKHVKRSKQVPVEKAGGWGPCKGPFSKYQAKKAGIKAHLCEKNCFTRTDANGNIYRGCYEGEWGVDPTRLGCHKQAGSLYCFCNKDNCNNKGVKPVAKKQ